MAEPFFAVDVGGSSVKSGVVVDGRIEEVAREPVAKGVEELVAQLVRLYADHAGSALLPWGLCLPGLVDSRRGLISYSANLELHDVSVLELLAAELPKPRVLENDLVAAAVGEAGGGTLALVQLGTGIAGRYVIDGAVPRAARAGEIGHLQFRPGGRRCPCGNRGCVEAYGGWRAIRERYEEAGRPVSSPATVLSEAETDPWARGLLDEALAAIGFAAAALVSVCDPGTLRVGGGVAAAWGETLLESIRASIATQVLPELAAATRVDPASLGNRAGLLGVYALAR